MRIFYKNDISHQRFDLLLCEMEPTHLRIYSWLPIFRREHIIPRKEISNWAWDSTIGWHTLHITVGKVQHTLRTTDKGNVDYLNWWYTHT